jgi:AcrR family transcriptional regulator
MDRLDVRAGRPPKGQAEALGDHVVAVADALFIEKGYGATSMATVSARARVGKQTLYRRFPDKATLFREVIRRRIDAMLVTPTDGAMGQDPLGELKKMARAALDTVLDPEFVRLYRVIIAEALPFPELACAAADNWGSSFADRCIDATRRAQAMGLCKPGDPETLAKCFLWSVTGEALLKGLAGQAPPSTAAERDAHLEIAWTIFLDGIATTAA